MPDHSLQDCRILVVEDEYMLAVELATELRDEGADVLGPVGTVEQALAVVDAELRIDGALLDVNLSGTEVFPVADLLAARGVPFLFTTGYDASVIPGRFAACLRCEKPVSIVQVKQAIGRIIHA